MSVWKHKLTAILRYALAFLIYALAYRCLWFLDQGYKCQSVRNKAGCRGMKSTEPTIQLALRSRMDVKKPLGKRGYPHPTPCATTREIMVKIDWCEMLELMGNSLLSACAVVVIQKWGKSFSCELQTNHEDEDHTKTKTPYLNEDPLRKRRSTHYENEDHTKTKICYLNEGPLRKRRLPTQTKIHY